MENGTMGADDVQVKQPFPLSNPDGYLVVERHETGEFVALIKDYKRLDPDSLAIVNEELEYRYFLPRITKIHSIKDEFGQQVWDVETDRGPRQFEVRNRKRDIRWLADDHILIQDYDGNKYEVQDFDLLDEESRGKLEMEV